MNCSHIATYCFSSSCCSFGATLFKKAQGSVVSSRIGMFFKQIRIYWQSPVFDLTSYFQNGGHDVRPPLVASYAVASTDCPLARWARLTSLARCMRLKFRTHHIPVVKYSANVSCALGSKLIIKWLSSSVTSSNLGSWFGCLSAAEAGLHCTSTQCNPINVSNCRQINDGFNRILTVFYQKTVKMRLNPSLIFSQSYCYTVWSAIGIILLSVSLSARLSVRPYFCLSVTLCIVAPGVGVQS